MPEWIQWLVAIVTPAAAGLIGVCVGAALTTRRERAARKHRFIERQLEELYSPMVGMRQEIRAKSELRLEISQAANASWQELVNQAPVDDRVDYLNNLTETRWPNFESIIEYDNRQLSEELLPAYRKMLDLFRDNYWMAEDSTRSHYALLIGFVEIWNRWTDDAIPPEVVNKIDRHEATLKPFYEDLDEQLRVLRSKLASGKA